MKNTPIEPYELTPDLPRLAKAKVEMDVFNSVDEIALKINSPMYLTHPPGSCFGSIIWFVLLCVTAIIIVSIMVNLDYRDSLNGLMHVIYDIIFAIVNLSSTSDSSNNFFYFKYFLNRIENDFLYIGLISTIIIIISALGSLPMLIEPLRAKPIIFNRKVKKIFYASPLKRIYYMADWQKTVMQTSTNFAIGTAGIPFTHKGFDFYMFNIINPEERKINLYFRGEMYTLYEQWEYIRTFMQEGKETLYIPPKYYLFTERFKATQKFYKNDISGHLNKPLTWLWLILHTLWWPIRVIVWPAAYIGETFYAWLERITPVPYIEDAAKLETEEDLLKFYEKYNINQDWIKVYDKPQSYF